MQIYLVFGSSGYFAIKNLNTSAITAAAGS